MTYVAQKQRVYIVGQRVTRLTKGIKKSITRIRDFNLPLINFILEESQWRYRLPEYTINQCDTGFSGGASCKESAANEGDMRCTGLIPGSGRSPGGGHGNPLQYFCLENLMERGAYWAMDHKVAKSQTWLKQLIMHARW